MNPDRGDRGGLSVLFDLFAAGQAARGLLNEALRQSPLKPDEYAVYSALTEPGPHTPTSIRRRLGMPAPTLSDYLANMEARSHLRRQTNPEDGRSAILSLTRAGQTAHARTARDFDPAIAALLKQLDGDVAALRAGLVDLREAAMRASEHLSSRDRPERATRR